MTPAFDPMDHETPYEDLHALDMLAAEVGDSFAIHSVVEAVEVGTWAGLTARVLAPHFDYLYCVDTWAGTASDRLGPAALRHGGPEEVFRTFCRNMGEDLFDTIFPLKGSSAVWASVFPRKVALVYIDADHHHAAVKADILAWRPHVLPGGVLCGHDYGVFDGVTRAVDGLIPADKLHRAGMYIWWTKVE